MGSLGEATVGTKNWTPEPAPDRFGQIPRSRGVVFICKHCSRPTATDRDAVLRAWGDRGVIADAAKKLRCRWCKKRGMDAALTPHWVGPEFGSRSDLAKLVDAIRKLKPRGEVS
jgi:hypothetical protein